MPTNTIYVYYTILYNLYMYINLNECIKYKILPYFITLYLIFFNNLYFIYLYINLNECIKYKILSFYYHILLLYS